MVGQGPTPSAADPGPLWLRLLHHGTCDTARPGLKGDHTKPQTKSTRILGGPRATHRLSAHKAAQCAVVLGTALPLGVSWHDGTPFFTVLPSTPHPTPAQGLGLGLRVPPARTTSATIPR